MELASESGCQVLVDMVRTGRRRSRTNMETRLWHRHTADQTSPDCTPGLLQPAHQAAGVFSVPGTFKYLGRKQQIISSRGMVPGIGLETSHTKDIVLKGKFCNYELRLQCCPLLCLLSYFSFYHRVLFLFFYKLDTLT